MDQVVERNAENVVGTRMRVGLDLNQRFGRHQSKQVAGTPVTEPAGLRPQDGNRRFGDGFVGGLLYGLLRGWPTERAMQFGWASGAYAAGSLTDYASPADEAAVWSIWQGNARVVR